MTFSLSLLFIWMGFLVWLSFLNNSLFSKNQYSRKIMNEFQLSIETTINQPNII